jgi:putative SOS response-associated peptidase YedK
MTSGRDIAEHFDLAGPPELFPRYNVAPTQPVLAVRVAGVGREAVMLRWGLVPSWAKDLKQAPINARAETAADKPTFRHALRKRRCLIPADGFYEWVALEGRKQPYCFRPGDGRPFAFAGLWERWEGPQGPVESCAILTTEANDLVRPVHDRMPVILPERHWRAWLDTDLQDAATVAPLLRPYPAEAMRAVSVHGPRVTSVQRDIEPRTGRGRGFALEWPKVGGRSDWEAGAFKGRFPAPISRETRATIPVRGSVSCFA